MTIRHTPDPGPGPQDSTDKESSFDLDSLLKMALDKSVEGRRNLTARLGDLFSGSTNTLNERERALMGDILHKLIHDCEMAVRRDLAERLSKAPNPPHSLIVALANDEIKVAHPILMNSGVLRDMELVGIVHRRSSEHQLAIAMRRALSEPVTDALVETGDTNVIKTLLENQDAQISQATMTYLAEESQRLDTYQEPLLKRRDLSPDLAKRMYLWVSAALRQHILENFEVKASELDDNLEGVAETLATDESPGTGKAGAASPAAVLAQRLKTAGRIDWTLFIRVLRQGEISLFEALFAELSGLSAERVSEVVYESGGENLAIACRALNMPKTTFATTYLLSRRGASGNRVSDPRALSRALLLFDKIKPQAANEVMKAWRRNEDYQTAIELIAGNPPRDSGT